MQLVSIHIICDTQMGLVNVGWMVNKVSHEHFLLLELYFSFSVPLEFKKSCLRAFKDTTYLSNFFIIKRLQILNETVILKIECHVLKCVTTYLNGPLNVF